MDNNVETIIVKSAKQFLSPRSSTVGNIFGDPLVLPRVGDQYQAKIPSLMMDCYCQQFMQKPSGTGIMTNYPNSFVLGLAIPIMQAQGEVENIKKEALEAHADQDDAVDTNWRVDVETSEDRHTTLNNHDAEVINKPLHSLLDNGEKVGLPILHPMIRGEKMDSVLCTADEKKTKLYEYRADDACSPLPGSLGEPWRPIEYDSFLLGLYIFGKNLLLVKRFVKSKEMGDILSYYYGKFYRSNEHRRWSECQKMRSRRCVHGQKIFTGWRQLELLSRLFSHVSEECQNGLREISREFGEGKCSLEEYVFTIKDTVGIGVLVEAIGIGKGKQDLTATTMDPIKTNNLLRLRPEIPIGKACSSLTSGEIIKFLTGDFRLSKARSNDLFWEAVWPRLLARGWHSEKPKDLSFSSSKHSLVFLIPGVKKFSRRKLVKGNHYFDSVTDVLNKVASDPRLLEVEIEAVKAGGHKEEYQSDLLAKQLPDSLSNWKRHCYLQPPVSNCNSDFMKFTIVDTSLIHGVEGSKIRELRKLPVDTRNISLVSDLSTETEQESSNEYQDKAEEINSLNPAEVTTGGRPFTKSPEISSIQDNGLPNEKESSCGLKSPGTCENREFQECPSQTFLTHSSLAQGNPDKSDQGIVDGNFLVTEPSSKRSKPDTLIDLNVPQVPEGLETDESFITDMVHYHDNSGANKALVWSDTGQQSNAVANTEQQQPVLSSRRQSTRNRPLTTRALEAIAFGFLSTTRKRKYVDAQTQRDSMSRSSRLVRGRLAASSILTGTADNDVV